jgi:hypothetical protein
MSGLTDVMAEFRAAAGTSSDAAEAAISHPELMTGRVTFCYGPVSTSPSSGRRR